MAKRSVDIFVNARDRASKALRSVTDRFGGLGAAAISLNQGLELAQKGFRGLQKVVETTVAPMAQFQQEMANVRTLVDSTDREFSELERGILRMGKSTPKALSDLTNASYDLISAGVQQKDVLWALNKAQKASVAGSADIKNAVAGSMATINAYNLSIGEMEHVFDLQFNTVKFGVITFEQLANSIGRILPASKVLGASLEEVHSAMALITKAGFTADEAATVLSRTMIALGDPDIQENFKELGVTIHDEVTGEFVGMSDVLKDLRDKTMNMTDAQKSAFFGVLNLQDRAMKGFVSLMDRVEDYDLLLKEMGKTGAMEEAYKKMSRTISNVWDTIKNKVKIAFIEWAMQNQQMINEFLIGIDIMARALPTLLDIGSSVFGGLVLHAKMSAQTFISFWHKAVAWFHIVMGNLQGLLNVFTLGAIGSFDELDKHFAKAREEFEKSNSWINEASDSFTTWKASMKDLTAKFPKLTPYFKELNSLIEGTHTGIQKAKDEFGLLAAAAEGFIGPLQEAREGIRELTDEEIEKRREAVDEFMLTEDQKVGYILNKRLQEMTESGKYTQQDLNNFAAASRRKQQFANATYDILMRGAAQAADSIVESMWGAQSNLREVFKQMAKDFVKYFIQIILMEAAKAAAKLVFTLIAFDVPENDRRAMQSGRDYIRWFMSGVNVELQNYDLAGLLSRGADTPALSMLGNAVPSGSYASQSSITIIIQGNVIGEEQWVKDKLVPVIEDARLTGDTNIAVE